MLSSLEISPGGRSNPIVKLQNGLGGACEGPSDLGVLGAMATHWTVALPAELTHSEPKPGTRDRDGASERQSHVSTNAHRNHARRTAPLHIQTFDEHVVGVVRGDPDHGL